MYRPTTAEVGATGLLLQLARVVVAYYAVAVVRNSRCSRSSVEAEADTPSPVCEIRGMKI